MAKKKKVFVIVGASAAGGTAAATLREEGFDGKIILIGTERLAPYERPPLSKEYLRGELPFEKAFIRAPEVYEELGIETHFGSTAVRLDTEGRKLLLRNGESVAFDSLLIATGIRNRQLDIPGRELAGVVELRTARDADRIRNYASKSQSVAIVGMGFIGAEVAASLREMGLIVTVLEFASTPLARALGERFGRVVEGIHRDNGVRMVFGEGVKSFKGVESVETVWTSSGMRIDCDFVVTGVGTQPNVEWLEGSGVEIDNGVVVDPTLRTNVPDVFAAGDIANHLHPMFGRIRVEHFDNALKMGQVAARNMLGREEVFEDPHWFWSDQYDTNIQMVGFPSAMNEIVVRGVEEKRNFIAFYLKERTIVAALGFNRAREVRRTIPLIQGRVRVEPDLLRDEEFDLRRIPVEGG